MFPILYSRNSDGSVQQWQVVVEKYPEGWGYKQVYGKVDGKLVTTKPTYAKAKNVGKSNETTPEKQAFLEAEALYEKKQRRNYFKDINDIDNGFLEPQLAKPCADYIDDVDWSKAPIVDLKLNGISCIATRYGLKSRNNEAFNTIPHIFADLQKVFEKYPDAYIQGELFNPKLVNDLGGLVELVSVARQPEDVTPEILEESKQVVEYHLYDAYNIGCAKEDDQLTRRMCLMELFEEFDFSYIFPITYERCTSYEDMEKYAKTYIAKGGEGVIIRNPDAPYQHKRTKDLLKFKKLESDEFRVLKLIEGTGDWVGCAKAALVENPHGKKEKHCKVNLRGTREFLAKALKEEHKYVDQMVTVEFQELSKDNVPLIPYSDLIIRNYE